MAEKLEGLDKYGDIERATFEQILEMDDDDERDFSMTLFMDFKQQAEQTICNMQAYAGLDTHDPSKPDDEQITPTVDVDVSMEDKLRQLSNGGHFLKGSSATLGLDKVQKGCEKIQHFGQRKNEAGDPSSDSDEVLMEKIRDTIVVVKKDYVRASQVLDKFYGLP